MPSKYFGHYHLNNTVVENWKYELTGVYYCGYINTSGNLVPLYIGRSIGERGIRGRLLRHLSEKNWKNVTHFGYIVCKSSQETLTLEEKEIHRHQPHYNIQGK